MALRTFADGRVFGEVTGTGAPNILALHGWGRRGSDFAAVLEGFNAIAVDLPGFGASPPPHTSMGAPGYADILSPLLQEFEAPPVVIGHSFGGRVAVCLAVRDDVALGSLVLTGVPLVRTAPPDKPRLGYRIVRSLNRAGVISDARLEAERQKRGSADYRAATGVMRDILVTVVNESYEGQLEQLRVPVAMVWGSEDAEVPVAVARKAAEIIDIAGGQATLEIVDGVGHLMPIEAPQRLRSALLGLVGR